jgi:hypothetical protein
MKHQASRLAPSVCLVWSPLSPTVVSAVSVLATLWQQLISRPVVSKWSSFCHAAMHSLKVLTDNAAVDKQLQ